MVHSPTFNNITTLLSLKSPTSKQFTTVTKDINNENHHNNINNSNSNSNSIYNKLSLKRMDTPIKSKHDTFSNSKSYNDNDNNNNNNINNNNSSINNNYNNNSNSHKNDDKNDNNNFNNSVNIANIEVPFIDQLEIIEETKYDIEQELASRSRSRSRASSSSNSVDNVSTPRSNLSSPTYYPFHKNQNSTSTLYSSTNDNNTTMNDKFKLTSPNIKALTTTHNSNMMSMSKTISQLDSHNNNNNNNNNNKNFNNMSPKSTKSSLSMMSLSVSASAASETMKKLKRRVLRRPPPIMIPNYTLTEEQNSHANQHDKEKFYNEKEDTEKRIKEKGSDTCAHVCCFFLMGPFWVPFFLYNLCGLGCHEPCGYPGCRCDDDDDY